MRKSVDVPKTPPSTSPATPPAPESVSADSTASSTEPATAEPIATPEPAAAVSGPASARPATPAGVYFTSGASQPHTSSKFWRGSPAEIVFATLTAFALILGVIFSITGFSGPPRATTANSGSNPSSNSGSNTGSNSQPAITVPDHKTYDASAPTTPQGNTVDVKLVAQETLISIGPGVAYKSWTFNGTVPGPILRVREGQTINFTLVNNTGMTHSIDFHAAETPWNVNYQGVKAGQSFSFSWKASFPGIFMYHCGTPPVIEHIANGMYGAIIVDPASGWTPAKEYVLVQSEFYTRKLSDGSYSYDNAKAMAMQPDYVTFNGYTNQYKDAPLTAQLGQRVRLFVLNAGPSEFSAFHVIGAMFVNTYVDGNPANHMVGNQTVTIPPGGGAVVELTIPEAGQYPFVTHSFANASSGALGLIEIKK
ncbi:MAG TPA: multicopper oxidase domain-containing protein [Ktedonobacterales bacterium]